MLDKEKIDISFFKKNFSRLKTISKFLDISLKKVIGTGENTEKLYRLKERFNRTHSNEHFNSDLEMYKAFIDYIKSHLEEKKFKPSTQVKKKVKQIIPPKAKESIQAKDPPVTNKKSKMRMYLQFLLKSGVFVLSFITPIFLFVTILIRFFNWNYLALLRYQPVLFFLLIAVMILMGIISGWLSLQLIQYYIKKRKDSLEYERLKGEFNEKIPFVEFLENKGTETQWYNKFERFLESKKDNNI